MYLEQILSNHLTKILTEMGTEYFITILALILIDGSAQW